MIDLLVPWDQDQGRTDHRATQWSKNFETLGLPIEAAKVMLNGAQVCDLPDHHPCTIAYGNSRRMEAVGALKGLGVGPPAWWEL